MSYLNGFGTLSTKNNEKPTRRTYIRVYNYSTRDSELVQCTKVCTRSGSFYDYSVFDSLVFFFSMKKIRSFVLFSFFYVCLNILFWIWILSSFSMTFDMTHVIVMLCAFGTNKYIICTVQYEYEIYIFI